MRDGLRSAAAAVTFLTAIPIGRRVRVDDRDLRSGALLFPLVGALIGTLVASVAWSTALVLPPFVAGVLAVAAGALVTGALHLDGLADTADGVGAALTGHDPTEAMHDPRLGTFGGVALCLDLLLRVAVLNAFVASDRFPFEVIAAGALGRVAALALIAALPYARSNGGTGSWTSVVGLGPCLAGVALATVIGILAAGGGFVVMMLAGVGVAVLVGRWSRAHLSGVTGDTLGAAVELTETLSLAVALAIR